MVSHSNAPKTPGGDDEWKIWAKYVLLTLEKLEKENEDLKGKCHGIPDFHNIGDRMIIVEQEQKRHSGFTNRIFALENTAVNNAEKIKLLSPLVNDLQTFKTKVETRTGLIAVLVSAGITILLFIIDKVIR